jgi:hypothetical protein
MTVHDVTAGARAAAPFEVLGFAVVATGGDAALLELAGRFAPDAWPAEHHPRLVVDAVDGRRAQAAPTTAVGDARTGAWRAAFAVPLAALDAGGFALALPRLLVELPGPDVLGDGAPQLVRLAREANALRRDLDAALARAAAAEAREQAARVPLAAARARAEEQVGAALARAQEDVARVRAEAEERLATARAEAEGQVAAVQAELEREREQAAQERGRLQEELATAIAQADEQVAGAHALGDERVAAVEAQAAEEIAALWAQIGEHGHAAAPDPVTAVATAPGDEPTVAFTAADEEDPAPEDDVATTVLRPGRALPPPSAAPLPADWTLPVVVAVLVLATLVFLLVLAGALS